MQHKSLSTQITTKSKKLMQNQQPAFFSEIPYSEVREINYLTDLQQKKKNIDFDIFQFQKDFDDQAPINQYDMLANNMYKKIMQNGYLQERKPPSKKKKKTKNPFQYDYEDVFINDEQAFTVKKNVEVKLQNFKSLNSSIEQFYNSELYKSNLLQIQQQSKKRTNDISMDAQQLEIMKKKIKQNISITYNRPKQEAQVQKKEIVSQNLNSQIQNNIKNQQIKIQQKQEQDLPSIENIGQQIVQQCQLKQINKIENVNQAQNSSQIIEEKQQETKKPKKKSKPAAKPKSVKKSSKTQKCTNVEQQVANQQANIDIERNQQIDQKNLPENLVQNQSQIEQKSRFQENEKDNNLQQTVYEQKIQTETIQKSQNAKQLSQIAQQNDKNEPEIIKDKNLTFQGDHTQKSPKSSSQGNELKNQLQV